MDVGNYSNRACWWLTACTQKREASQTCFLIFTSNVVSPLSSPPSRSSLLCRSPPFSSSLLLPCDPFFFTSSLLSSLLFLQPRSLPFCFSLLLLLPSFHPSPSLRPLCLFSPVPLQRDCSQNPLTFIPRRRRYVTILKTLSCVTGNPASDRSRCLQGFSLVWPRPRRPAPLSFMHLVRSWKRFSAMLHKAAAVE